jgi:hypothetical protein
MARAFAKLRVIIKSKLLIWSFLKNLQDFGGFNSRPFMAPGLTIEKRQEPLRIQGRRLSER